MVGKVVFFSVIIDQIPHSLKILTITGWGSSTEQISIIDSPKNLHRGILKLFIHRAVSCNFRGPCGKE